MLTILTHYITETLRKGLAALVATVKFDLGLSDPNSADLSTKITASFVEDELEEQEQFGLITLQVQRQG